MGKEWGPKKGWRKGKDPGGPSSRPPRAPKNVWTRSGKFAQPRIAGLDEVIRNLRKNARKMKDLLKPAVTEMVAIIQRESMEYTPIRTGFLRASHRSQVVGSAARTVGTIFVMAYYALFVHEAPPSVVFRSPWPRGRKFLERAVNDNLGKLLAVIPKWIAFSKGRRRP